MNFSKSFGNLANNQSLQGRFHNSLIFFNIWQRHIFSGGVTPEKLSHCLREIIQNFYYAMFKKVGMLQSGVEIYGDKFFLKNMFG